MSKNLWALTSSPAKLTTVQLTSFAIALANRTRNRNPGTLVKEAFAIWKAANTLLTKLEPPVPVKPVRQKPPDPTPKSFPITLDKFLGLMLPKLKGRTGDKYHIFRQYLDYRNRNQDQHRPRLKAFFDEHEGDPVPPEPTEGDIDQRFARWREVGIPNLEAFRYHAWEFRQWYRTDYTPKRKAESSAAKANNAFIRRAKDKLHEHLWTESCRGDPKARVTLEDFPGVSDAQMARLLEINKGTPLKDYRTWNYQL
jgi:hypothetical protein